VKGNQSPKKRRARMRDIEPPREGRVLNGREFFKRGGRIRGGKNAGKRRKTRKEKKKDLGDNPKSAREKAQGGSREKKSTSNESSARLS